MIMQRHQLTVCKLMTQAEKDFNFIALGTVGTKVERPVVFIDWYS